MDNQPLPKREHFSPRGLVSPKALDQYNALRSETKFEASDFLFVEVAMALLQNKRGFSIENRASIDTRIADIGYGSNVEILKIIEKYMNVYLDNRLHFLACDTNPEDSFLKDLLHFSSIPEDRISFISIGAENESVFQSLNYTGDTNFELIIIRNPDTHTGVDDWTQAFIHASNHLSSEGNFLITCENERELENNIALLKKTNLEWEVLQNTDPGKTHSTRSELFWILAHRREQLSIAAYASTNRQ